MARTGRPILLRVRRAAAIVEHTVALAHALGLRLVAEGVEDAATGAALADLDHLDLIASEVAAQLA